MERIVVDPERPDSAAIARAARVIREGGVVAFPTETVYGLGANALDASAVRRIFSVKGRPSYNPLIAHCSDPGIARRLALDWPEAAERLSARYWPGPLTLVVRKRPIVPDEVTAGLPTVAVRVPDHPVALAILRAAGVPVAAPSANRFTELSPTTADHVARSLGGRIDLIVDGGPTRIGIESTVVDVTGQTPVLLRPGSIETDALEATIGQSLASPAVYTSKVARPAPGMTPRHYAPKARVTLSPCGDQGALAFVLANLRERSATPVAVLLRTLPDPIGADVSIRMPSEPEEYARVLYSTLHDLDDRGMAEIVIEAPPDLPQWAGVADRLRRASVPVEDH